MDDDGDSEANIPDVDDNDNGKQTRRMNFHEVDEIAHALNAKYSDEKDYFKFYCKAIWKLGKRRVYELEARVSDAKYPGKLLSKLIKDELAIVEGRRNRNGD